MKKYPMLLFFRCRFGSQSGRLLNLFYAGFICIEWMDGWICEHIRIQLLNVYLKGSIIKLKCKELTIRILPFDRDSAR